MAGIIFHGIHVGPPCRRQAGRRQTTDLNTLAIQTFPLHTISAKQNVHHQKSWKWHRQENNATHEMVPTLSTSLQL